MALSPQPPHTKTKSHQSLFCPNVIWWGLSSMIPWSSIWSSIHICIYVHLLSLLLVQFNLNSIQKNVQSDCGSDSSPYFNLQFPTLSWIQTIPWLSDSLFSGFTDLSFSLNLYFCFATPTPISFHFSSGATITYSIFTAGIHTLGRQGFIPTL